MKVASLLAKYISANATGTVSRFMGGFGSGPPSVGTYKAGDFITDAKGFMWVCTSDGTPGSWERVGKNGFFYTREYGIKFDGATDSTTRANNTAGWVALAAAIQAVVTPGLKGQAPNGAFQGGNQLNGGGSALTDPGVCVVDYIDMAHRMLIQGHGLGSTLMQSANQTRALISNRRDGIVHAKYCTVRDIRLHGNSDNQTSANCHGVLWQGEESYSNYQDQRDEDYDERHALINVDILKTKGANVRMVGAGRNLLMGVTGRNAGLQGVYSFQDNNGVNVDIGWAGTACFEVAGDDNRWTDSKGWYGGQVTPAQGVAWKLTADSGTLAGCSAQDCTAEALTVGNNSDSGFGWSIGTFMADSNSKGSAGTYAQVKVAGANNNIEAVVRNRYNAGGPGTVALEVVPGSLQNKITINPGTGPWGVTTLLKSGSDVSGNEVVFGANAKGWVNLAAVSNVFTANPLLGSRFRCGALTANSTFANPPWKWDGASIRVRVQQNGTGGFTLGWGSDFESGIPNPNSAPNAVTIYDFVHSSTSGKWERWN